MTVSPSTSRAQRVQDHAQAYLVAELAALGALLMLGGPWLGGWLAEQGSLSATGAGLLSGVSLLLGACSAVAAVLFSLAYWLPGAPQEYSGFADPLTEDAELAAKATSPYTADRTTAPPSA